MTTDTEDKETQDHRSNDRDGSLPRHRRASLSIVDGLQKAEKTLDGISKINTISKKFTFLLIKFLIPKHFRFLKAEFFMLVFFTKTFVVKMPVQSLKALSLCFHDQNYF